MFIYLGFLILTSRSHRGISLVPLVLNVLMSWWIAAWYLNLTDKYKMGLQQWFSMRDDFVPQWTIGNLWRECWLSQLGDVTGICRAEARNEARHLTAPSRRIIQPKMSVVQRLRNPGLQETESPLWFLDYLLNTNTVDTRWH